MSELYAIVSVVVGIILGCLIMSGCFSLINTFNIYRECLWKDVAKISADLISKYNDNVIYDVLTEPHRITITLKTEINDMKYSYKYTYFFWTIKGMRDNYSNSFKDATERFHHSMHHLQETLDQTEGTKDNV